MRLSLFQDAPRRYRLVEVSGQGGESCRCTEVVAHALPSTGSILASFAALGLPEGPRTGCCSCTAFHETPLSASRREESTNGHGIFCFQYATKLDDDAWPDSSETRAPKSHEMQAHGRHRLFFAPSTIPAWPSRRSVVSSINRPSERPMEEGHYYGITTVILRPIIEQ